MLIKNASLINEGEILKTSLAVKDGKIHLPESGTPVPEAKEIIDAEGLYLLPGVIDDQVHFRDPGLTHKGDIYTESRAAAAGGVTSYMEMPNTKPQTVNQEALRDKFNHGAIKSLVNYSFYIGATNDNLDELVKTDSASVCGVKIFMGSSTGNMLVDNPESLKNIFSNISIPIAVHCEDENTIIENTKRYKTKFGEDVPISYHPVIRSAEACYKSSSMAVDLATKYGARLHILHLSTKKELELFRSDIPLEDKRITSEVCVHHLWFNDSDYNKFGARIKWNPAVKSVVDQEALLQALIEGKIDVVATDHAPHTLEEKSNKYFGSPSGGPLVQHSLVAILELFHQGKITLEQLVEKMCHNPAKLFNIDKRGYLRNGYWADMVLVDLNKPWTVTPQNILYKCKWSPFEQQKFRSSIVSTFVNGKKVYDNTTIIESKAAMKLEFNRS